MKLYLVGMMGSGKSAVGSLLAARLGWRFVDVDAEIVRVEGRSIAQIFEEKGEAAFRALESLAVAGATAEASDAVISLGGGAVLDPNTRRRLRETGRTAWLRAAPSALATRVAGEDRPLLRGLAPEARARRIDEILAERTPLYEEVADLFVDTEGRTPANVAEELAKWVLGAKSVRVELGPRAYDVAIEVGALARIGRRLRKAGLGPGRAALVTDENVAKLYLERALGSLKSAGFDAVPAIAPAGEGAKRLSEVERLAEICAEARLDRGALVIGLGGGAVTDLAGFLAAVYCRGVSLVLVPTTLLGMVDAAIGGKNGVNLERGKNLVGAFWQPRLVLADPDVLATLPPAEWTSGLGEVLKYALIGSAELFQFVGERLAGLGEPKAAVGNGEGGAGVPELIARCAAIKAAIVSEDERETASTPNGGRKVLNFGHTIGHAIEAAAGYGAITHGEAVILGMRAAIHLSRRAGLLAAPEETRLTGFLKRVKTAPLPAGLTDEKILEPLARDKKFARGKFLFVLLRGQGAPVVDVEVTKDDVLAALATLRES